MEAPRRTAAGLSRLTEKLDQLPVLPSVVIKLLSLRDASETFFDEVLAITNEDPPLAVRVVQAANASDSAPASPILTLRNAVTRLGARRIGSLVTSMAVTRVFVPTTPEQRHLWAHSIEVAVAARRLAELRNVREVAPERAYLAGLLHDIGRFVMFEGAPEDLDRVGGSGWVTPADLVASERALCGFDHAEVGWAACRRWGLPDEIAEVVRDHHVFDAEGPQKTASARAQIVALVQMADLLSMLLRSEPKLAECEPDDLVPTLAARCVAPDWAVPPVAPEALAECVAPLMEESRRLVADLGLDP